MLAIPTLNMADLGCLRLTCATCRTHGFGPFQSCSSYFILPRSIKKNLENDVLTPVELLRYFKQPVAGTRAAVRAADYMETTLTLLKEKLRWAVKGDFNVTGQGVNLLGGRQSSAIADRWGAWSTGLSGVYEEGGEGIYGGQVLDPSHQS